MNNIIFFDDDHWKGLLPLTFAKPVSELRCGILTIREKWLSHYSLEYSWLTMPHLMEKYPFSPGSDNLVINSTYLPHESLLSLVDRLEVNQALVSGDELVAARLDTHQLLTIYKKGDFQNISLLNLQNADIHISAIKRPYDIFKLNATEINNDLQRIKLSNGDIDIHSRHIGDYPLIVEAGVKISCSIFNTTKGPIYLAEGSEIMEGSMIRGPFALGAHSTVKMGTKIYEECSVGPHSKVGGELQNVVIQGYSNKGHDGYLGNSVIGEWCNIGADSNNSNLKNNYEEVKLWDYTQERFAPSGLQFCGLIMGDHSKCGINTMFNTGTVVGFCANIFGDGFPRNLIPSFAWGGASGFITYMPDKAIATAERVMSRRGINLTEQDKSIFKAIFEMSKTYRNWEKKNQE
jgi:UDP-N-acetylglucosamine diphosphorylase/glucosamine-1-phosphate N-acetyltransferase